LTDHGDWKEILETLREKFTKSADPFFLSHFPTNRLIESTSPKPSQQSTSPKRAFLEIEREWIHKAWKIDYSIDERRKID
jgi:hypothetical protein